MMPPEIRAVRAYRARVIARLQEIIDTNTLASLDGDQPEVRLGIARGLNHAVYAIEQLSLGKPKKGGPMKPERR